MVWCNLLRKFWHIRTPVVSSQKFNVDFLRTSILYCGYWEIRYYYHSPDQIRSLPKNSSIRIWFKYHCKNNIRSTAIPRRNCWTMWILIFSQNRVNVRPGYLRFFLYLLAKRRIGGFYLTQYAYFFSPSLPCLIFGLGRGW